MDRPHAAQTIQGNVRPEEGSMKNSSRIAFAVAALVPAAASAQMTCTQLGTHLSTLPHISPYTAPGATTPLPLTQLTGTPARCEANFIYSARGGPRHGYAVGQDQRIGIRVGFPVNSLDGGSGGVQGAWNGKVRNIGGGGLQGQLSAVTAATNTGYVGSNTDTGHPTTDNPNFAVIQETHELNEGRLDDFLNESLKQQYQWTLRLTQVYYGRKHTRNYWDGCSTGGREGLALALRHGKDFDGFLTGAPANFHTRLQVATVWPSWVNQELAGSTLTNQQMTAANASAVAACDVDDGVVDGLVRDARTCSFDANANVCGQPGAPIAPACLTPQQAAAVNRIWDGPRNDHGTRIWFPFGRGANASVLNAPPFGGPC